MDIKILSVILAAISGATISFIAFQYKSRKEVVEKINESLFHLLEVWSLVVMLKIITSENFSIKFIERLKEKFPYENFDDKLQKEMLNSVKKSMPMIIKAQSSPTENYFDKYSASIKEISKIYPMMAFNMSSNQMLMKFLQVAQSGVDLTTEEELFFMSFSDVAYKETVEQLEKDLRILSTKTSRKNRMLVEKYIDKINGRVNEIPVKILDDYIATTIEPFINNYYEQHELMNPNQLTEVK